MLCARSHRYVRLMVGMESNSANQTLAIKAVHYEPNLCRCGNSCCLEINGHRPTCLILNRASTQSPRSLDESLPLVGDMRIDSSSALQSDLSEQGSWATFPIIIHLFLVEQPCIQTSTLQFSAKCLSEFTSESISYERVSWFSERL